MMHKFPLRFWFGYLNLPQKYYNNSLSFYFGTFKCSFDFDVSIAYDVAFDIAKCTLLREGDAESAHFNQ